MSSLLETLKLIDAAKTEGNFEALTALYKKFEHIEFPPGYLVHKAVVIQLSDGNEYTLEDAQACLQKALLLDANCLGAYIELGYFHYAIRNDATQAITHFDEGYLRAKQLLLEIELGRAKTLIDLSRDAEALAVINNPYYAGCKDFELLKLEMARRSSETGGQRSGAGF